MPAESPSKPVTDSISKVNNDIAVGSDLAFQRRWWTFEVYVWTLFTILVILAALGCFGRGPVAKKQYKAADGSLNVQYERVARFGTPSLITATFSPDTVQDGRTRIWASGDLIKTLGAQRVVPQPVESVLTAGGVRYTFPAESPPLSVEFFLQPSQPGMQHLTLQVPGRAKVHLGIFVMP